MNNLPFFFHQTYLILISNSSSKWIISNLQLTYLSFISHHWLVTSVLGIFLYFVLMLDICFISRFGTLMQNGYVMCTSSMKKSPHSLYCNKVLICKLLFTSGHLNDPIYFSALKSKSEMNRYVGDHLGNISLLMLDYKQQHLVEMQYRIPFSESYGKVIFNLLIVLDLFNNCGWKLKVLVWIGEFSCYWKLSLSGNFVI